MIKVYLICGDIIKGRSEREREGRSSSAIEERLEPLQTESIMIKI